MSFNLSHQSIRTNSIKIYCKKLLKENLKARKNYQKGSIRSVDCYELLEKEECFTYTNYYVFNGR